MTRLHRVLAALAADLGALGTRYALIGGLAVAVRARPRFTADVDLAVSVASDADSERVVHDLRKRGYRLKALLEHVDTKRLATVRLHPPQEPDDGVVVDLLFASCGIEPEVVAGAERFEIVAGLVLPVVSTAHLIALKVLARDDVRRPNDRADLLVLLRDASTAQLDEARQALRSIQTRGYGRNKDLLGDLASVLQAARDPQE